jgi:predicted alpha/beta-hydrolase family hydrolase
MNESGENFERDTEPAVRGHLHTPSSATPAALVLTHGAGSNCGAPLLVALANAFAATGYLVLRCDLPFRQMRRTGPPRPGDAARDREGLAKAVDAVRELVPGKIFLGGHSYGGRQSSMLVAEHPDLVSGLLLLSYPLHPPRSPHQLRVQHLPKLCVPCLFVHGARDPFGTNEEIQAALKLIPAKAAILEVEGAGHDLGFRKKQQEELPMQIVEEFRTVLE